VQGSHIVVKQLFEGTQAYLLQNQDGRVVFAIPFEGDFTLIGTTDVPFQGDLKAVHIAPWEVDYLCEAVNRYFTRTVSPADVVWTYSGVRALQQAETSNLSEITRDYELRLETGEYGLPALTVIGGKITTYRKLAEAALTLLHAVVGGSARPWTASAALPGGDLPSGNLSDYLQSCRRRWSAVPPAVLARLVHSYGTELERFLAGVSSLEALGEHFGAGLTAAEVEHLRTREWAQTTDDILWRRSKLGLHLPAEGVARLQRYLRGTTSR
jgi:glycerol-3-phosphate dehydrogenase